MRPNLRCLRLWRQGADAGNQEEVASARSGLSCSVAGSWPHVSPNQVASIVNQAALRYGPRHPWSPVVPEILDGRFQEGRLNRAAIGRLKGALFAIEVMLPQRPPAASVQFERSIFSWTKCSGVRKAPNCLPGSDLTIATWAPAICRTRTIARRLLIPKQQRAA